MFIFKVIFDTHSSTAVAIVAVPDVILFFFIFPYLHYNAANHQKDVKFMLSKKKCHENAVRAQHTLVYVERDTDQRWTVAQYPAGAVLKWLHV